MYYLSDGNNRKGPYSLQQLGQQNLKPSSLIWKEGEENWQTASQVPELYYFFQGKGSSDNAGWTSLAMIVMIIWLVCSAMNQFIPRFFDQWYDSPVRYLLTATTVFYVLLPFFVVSRMDTGPSKTVGWLCAFGISMISMYFLAKELLQIFGIYW